MQTATETKIFEAPGVLITNARCILDNTTYATANVSSVRVGLKDGAGPYILCGVLFVVFALIAFVNGGYIGGVVCGCIAAAVFWAASQAKTWFVVLHTNSGEVRAIKSRDRVYIQNVVGGISNAIIHRG